MTDAIVASWSRMAGAAPRVRRRFRPSPAHQRIAATLLAQRELLALRTALLVEDVRERFNVAPCTAMRAIAIARRYA